MATEFSDLDRRLRAVESSRPATMRFGEVTQVDEKTGAARAKIADADGMVSGALRVLQSRTKNDQSQELPDVGQQVACLFSGQGFEQGVVLGGTYSDKDPSPARPPHVWYRRFEDGTELEYDRQAHRLTMKINGDLTIEATGTVKINAAKVSIQE